MTHLSFVILYLAVTGLVFGGIAGASTIATYQAGGDLTVLQRIHAASVGMTGLWSVATPILVIWYWLSRKSLARRLLYWVEDELQPSVNDYVKGRRHAHRRRRRRHHQEESSEERAAG